MAGISKQALRKEIAAILKGADLADTSAKKVRQELEEKLDCKLISRKKEIDELVMEYVSNAADKKGKKDSEGEEDDEEDEEEVKKESDEEENSEDEEEEEKKKPVKRTSAAKKPPAKRAKKDSDESDASDASGDASEEEYSPAKKTGKAGRPGRKAGQKKKKGSDSDGDEDWVQEKPAPRKSGGAGKGKGYTRPLTLSPELAALVGQEVMARHEVVQKMWAIIKEKNLYDPKNKQYAICDDAMQKVIGVKRFRTFGMMKYLKDHFIA